ncbi:hypothetical protein CEE37_06030 [candidate division LCP-89 bacterium B3_LCP]|uniref:carboxypeptidase T n=1 Tax=candidate division LCP-89 bacterium B3_LCP TaxID=2012998 RepID=A0A532V1Y1_UNCL8|nr:MAG: hypothetical protein CEE37_06030 [candidate division LCP-89 bacterium B3_LCP]
MKQMQRFTVLITTLLILAGGIPASANHIYHTVLVPNPDQQTVLIMAGLGLPLDDSRIIEGEGLEIPLREIDLALLDDQGISYQIVQEDLESYYGEICLKNMKNIPGQTDEDPVHMKYGSMGGFYNFEEIVADLDSMHMLYPDICAEKVILGYGWDDNPIYMVKISDNVEINEDEPEGIFDALHHAREPGSYTCLLYGMWNLLENYGIDPVMTYLVDNRELYFVPVVNPDGFLYNILTNPGGGGMWRKNRRDNGGGVYGVDLNRNYTYQWGYDNQGSSPTPSSSTYRGPEPGSEPEAQTMMNFIGDHTMTTGMTVHTAAGVFITAYGYANVPPEHYDVHMEYMEYASALNGYSYGTCYQIMYASNGRTQDWQLHTHDIINLEPEVGGNGFWPPVSQIFPEARDIQRCIMNQFWCAGGQIVYQSVRVVDGYLTPGESDEIVVTVFNRGWGTSEPIEFELTTSDPYITLSTATGTTPAIPRRETADNAADPIIADIDPTCPAGHQANFTLTINQSGYLRTEVITLTVGTPSVFFEDDMESGVGGWTHEIVTPGWTDQWHLSTANSHSPTHSWKFGDTGIGSYANNADGALISPVINIGVSSELKFWSWIVAEASGAYPDSAYDGGTVEIFYGGTWEVLPMDGYTHYIRATAGGGNPYTGPFDPATPVFSGNSGGWVEQTANLSLFTGDIQLRFRFGSDNGGAETGWYVDDVLVTGFPSGGVPQMVVEVDYVSGSPVPAGGGDLYYAIWGENQGAVPLDYDIWIDKIYESSDTTTLILREITNYQPGWQINRPDAWYPVPAVWPGGNYDFRIYSGWHPEYEVWHTDAFSWVKDGPVDLGFDFEANLPTAGFPNPFDEIIETTADLAIPTSFGVVGVYPNPFNPSTVLSYKLPDASIVNLSVYDISGRLVTELVNGWRDAGVHEVTFNGSALASGIYIYQLDIGSHSASGKMVLMK